MDPVDNAGAGAAALAKIVVPVAINYSEPQSCNSNGSAEVLYAAARPPKRAVKIVGANHSDAQDPTSLSSAFVCGSSVAARQALYRRYVVGWFEFHLRGDHSYARWVTNSAGGPLAADVAANRIVFAEAPARFAAWQAVQFGPDSGAPLIAGEVADAEGDGLGNLLEFACGLDPLSAAGSAAALGTVTESGLNYLALTFSRVQLSEGVRLSLEASSDLQAWSPGSSYSSTGSVPATAATTEVSRVAADGVESIVVRANAPLLPGKQRVHLRLRAERE